MIRFFSRPKRTTSPGNARESRSSTLPASQSSASPDFLSSLNALVGRTGKNGRRCKHGLSEFSTPNAYFQCDQCKDPMAVWSTMFGCREVSISSHRFSTNLPSSCQRRYLSFIRFDTNDDTTFLLVQL